MHGSQAPTSAIKIPASRPPEPPQGVLWRDVPVPPAGSLSRRGQRPEEEAGSLIGGLLPSLASGRPHSQRSVPSEQILELN